MNENTLEKLLRKAPPVRPPAGLLEQLQRDVELPRTTARAANHESRTTNGLGFRRWIPALGFALWFLWCIVVFGLQANEIRQLKKQQQAEAWANAARAEQAKAAETARAVAIRELEQVKKDVADVQRLRVEVESLRASQIELAQLRADNLQLGEELKSLAPTADGKPKVDFFATHADRANRIKCINNLKQVGLAARMWSNDHGDVLPPNYEAMKNEMVNDKVSFCPSDGTTRYELLSPGGSEAEPQVVFTRCPIHNNVGLNDGSAQMLGPDRKVVQKDGKWVIATEK